MARIDEVLEAFAQEPAAALRGGKFERLMLEFFRIRGDFADVWLWKDWPGRDATGDIGIDLVGRNIDDDGFTAIQCKFYRPTTRVAKPDVDSFLSASGRAPFTRRVWVSTTDKWNRNAEATIERQSIPVTRLSLVDLRESPIEWELAWGGGDFTVNLEPAAPKTPFPYQQEAIDDVFAGWEHHDRGKLIMACGTGKTFTSLKIAERVAAANVPDHAAAGHPGSARVLFCVPSISLLAQTLREWTAQVDPRMGIRTFAVCSDSKVSRGAEDISTVDVPTPVTTDPVALVEAMSHGRRAAGLTVVFTTYQSIGVVHDAQARGLGSFDLVICDEAHRTTGVTLAGEDSSSFVKVHDDAYITAAKRLYMTATPRIFDEKVKDRAADHSAVLASMDDEAMFGPEFHNLGFGAAVEMGRLTDYKVLVLTVDENEVAGSMQARFAADTGELALDDASKIVGCWNGLAKRAGADADGHGFASTEPMRRAVAFAENIAASKQIAEQFPRVVDNFTRMLDRREEDGHAVDGTNRDLVVEARHVDGTMNALQRAEQLSWLKAPVADDECRILTNARCLSEGVDVPALDAVIFLQPRNSVVDVVQSVGRVMRKAPGKEYGYIILPVAVPAGVSPDEALGDNRRFRVVWQVLNALRSHDERFDAMVNSLALTSAEQRRAAREARETGTGAMLMAAHVGPTADDGAEGPGDPGRTRSAAAQVALFSLAEWSDAILTRIVDKVGTRKYWAEWAEDVADIATALITRITATVEGASRQVRREFRRFHKGLQDNLNEGLSEVDAVSMLAQHMLTKPVFDALFSGHEFAAHNPVSRVMDDMVRVLEEAPRADVGAETRKLEEFYASVRRRAEQVTTAEGKQAVIAELYEEFFRVAFARQAEALGIVYTPVEIVDFILRAADEVSREHFGKGLTDVGVHVLDPFTGTGTFLVRLLQSGLIRPADLARKYASELHASEIMLLAYYIACVNIETTYHALAGGDGGREVTYEPFAGAVLADTFQTTEEGDALDFEVFRTNNERIARQLATPIHVIVGNPPYSVGQANSNDLNENQKYPTLDARIRDTYADLSTGGRKAQLYDSYLRAFRWASDRIGEAGIVAFVSNGGWIDGNTADGVRLSMQAEFDEIYVYNLRGNQRTAGEESRKEGGKVFGAGSRNTVAVTIAVRTGATPAERRSARIRYYAVDDYLTAAEKLAGIATAEVSTVRWREIAPNAYGDWVNQRSEDFGTWPVLGEKKDTSVLTFFDLHSLGLFTGRDAWCYASSQQRLDNQLCRMSTTCNAALADFSKWCADGGVSKPRVHDVDLFLRQRPDLTATGSISWNHNLKKHLASFRTISVDSGRVFQGVYRPWFRQHVQFQSEFNERGYQLPRLFPTPAHDNIGFYAVNPGSSKPFSVLGMDVIPDLALYGSNAGQFFPRWTWEPVESPEGELDFAAAAADVGGGAGPGEEGEVVDGYRRVDNITDGILALYREALGADVTKDEIFHFVYGQLHDPAYRRAYAADLRKMLPRIDTPADRARFDQLAAAGRELMALHVGYEDVEPYPLDIQVKPTADPGDRETWRVTTMRWAKTTDPETGRKINDTTSIIYNPRVTISGIPAEAEGYQLGSRSALAWILDRYQVKTDKKSGIVNDPNDWCDEAGNPRYIVDLIGRVTRVAVETTRIVESLRMAPEAPVNG
ncbi:DEAD/DEAH box helicase [Corynebacterium sp.]|uniref:DEAD/DEAH box helicase n=1 Tax=Corynebacterium sp. TaxID=1720 RepID=UPI0026DC1EFD|nr:DEAD/DEAH box helicase [Corynebacterium sp.]MDO4610413.1 DEAD/DEAH box helicase [Corynebacterium sp.]